MRLEYLPEGSPDCPLIRLYDFAPAEAQCLRSLVKELALGTRDVVLVHEEPFVEGDCWLTFRTGATDHGVRQKRAGQFECILSPSAWDNIEALLEPFCEPGSGYQWLSNQGAVALLMSRDGAW